MVCMNCLLVLFACLSDLRSQLCRYSTLYLPYLLPVIV